MLQRMLIQFDENTRAEAISAQRLRESDPVEFRDGTIANLYPGEILHLLAHSDQTAFGPFTTAATLFAELLRKGLTPSVGGIQLLGCESAQFARALETLVNTPSASWRPDGPIQVRGIPGYHLVSTTGTSFSVGAERGDEAFWTRSTGQLGMRPVTVSQLLNANPTDAVITQTARTYGGTVVVVDRLGARQPPPEMIVQLVGQGLAATAARRLQAYESGEDPFAAQDIASLNRMMASYHRVCGAAVPDTTNLDDAEACRTLIQRLPLPPAVNLPAPPPAPRPAATPVPTRAANAGRPLPLPPAVNPPPPPPPSPLITPEELERVVNEEIERAVSRK